MPVYFIRAGESGPVKIGYAINPHSRLYGLQTGQAEPLKIIRLTTGDLAQEAAFHRHFKPLRIRGEWFSYSDEMLTHSIDGASEIQLPEEFEPKRNGERPARGEVCLNIDIAIFNIRDFLWDYNLTPAELADAAGIEESAIQSVQDPDWNPDARTLRALGHYITQKWSERRALRTASHEAVSAAGGAGKVAKTLGLRGRDVGCWPRIPREHVDAVEALSGVSRHVLRPDLYPREGEAA